MKSKKVNRKLKMITMILIAAISAGAIMQSSVMPAEAAGKKPAQATVKSVKSPVAGKVTVKWKKVSGAKGYQIAYATNSKFKSKQANFQKF